MEIYWFAVVLGIIAGIVNGVSGNPIFSLKSIMTTLVIVIPGCVMYYDILG